MSHKPGPSLEDWITDWHNLFGKNLDYGTDIRRYWYSGVLVVEDEEFQHIVSMYEPIREHIEQVLYDYDEDNGISYRDYCGQYVIPKEIEQAVDSYIKSLRDKVQQESTNHGR